MARDIGLTHPVSELAVPQIRPDEAKSALTALCPRHGSTLAHLNEAGRVYLCPHPAGLMFWRASESVGGMFGRLKWPKGL